jgi:hypothetical protein
MHPHESEVARKMQFGERVLVDGKRATFLYISDGKEMYDFALYPAGAVTVYLEDLDRRVKLEEWEEDPSTSRDVTVRWEEGDDPGEVGWYLVTWLDEGKPPQKFVSYLRYNPLSVDRWYEGVEGDTMPCPCRITHWAKLPEPA